MSNTKSQDSYCAIETGMCVSDSNKFRQNVEGITLVKKRHKPKLIYYYDALCGWCYGFSDVISEIEKTFDDKLEIEIISGGLFLNNRVGFVNDVAPHIKAGAYKVVEERTGVLFGDNFLNDVFGSGKLVLNSLYPAIALCIIKEKLPEKQFEFAELLLKAVYFDGIQPENHKEYRIYVERIGFDVEDFLIKMNEEKYKILANIDFKRFATSGFSGMPGLVLKTKEKEVVLTHGYSDFKNIAPILNGILTE